MKKIAVIMVLGAAFALGGCKKNPCEQLAEKICKDLGKDHEGCKEGREKAGKATDAEKKECEEFLGKYDEMMKMIKEFEKLGGEMPGGAPPADEPAPPPPADEPAPPPPADEPAPPPQ